MQSSDGFKFSGMRSLSMEMGSEEAKRFSEVDSRDMYSRVKLRAVNGRICAGRDGNLAVENVKSLNDGSKKSRVSDEVNSVGIHRKMEDVDSVINTKKLAISGSNNENATKRIKLVNSVVVDGGQAEISSRARKGNRGAREGNAILDLIDASREERLNTSGLKYEVGDLVWGKVKSHPWWPGQIFEEAFASPSVFSTKREGHVLVSFYGDNSYGWLKPAALIPFDVHYAEKSKQTDDQPFLTAVEGVVDEVKKRAALGLACCHQFLSNFRPTSVQGFFEVDVRGYEPGGLYSLKQIGKARDDFQPFKTLSFIRKLALVPRSDVQRNVSWMKNVAQVIAYRMAVFEEFDETYAQAFGRKLVRARDSVVVLKDQEKVSLQDLLSSQPMIADVLGESKGSMKPVNVEATPKKDKILSKWRDEQNVTRDHRLSKGSVDHILQKGAPPSAMTSEFSGKYNPHGFVVRDNATPSPGCVGREALTKDKKSVLVKATSVDGQLNKGNVKSPTGFSVDPTTQSSTYTKDFHRVSLSAKSESSGPQEKGEELVGMKPYRMESSNTSQCFQNSLKHELQTVDVTWELSPLDAKCHNKFLVTSDNAGDQKPNILKHPGKHLHLNKSDIGEMKMKEESVPEQNQKCLKTRSINELTRKLDRKSCGTGLCQRENSQIDQERKGNGNFSTVYSDLGNFECELSVLVKDLLVLARDPFYGLEINIHENVQHFVLRFRSLVYKKSSSLAPSAEAKTMDIGLIKSPNCNVATETPRHVNIKDLPSAFKPLKKRFRLDDPAQASENHGTFFCQEETYMKRLDRSNEMNSLTAEMKDGDQKHPKVQREDEKKIGVIVSANPVKDSPMKQETVTGAAEPTMLVMKFPPHTGLPSVSELKAKFGRFGSLDQSATRVFWKSLTCHVVFQTKYDAQAAYYHALQSRILFGNRKVHYHLQALDVSGLGLLESGKWLDEEASGKFPPLRSTSARDSAGEIRSTALQQIAMPPGVQLKSCLKMPTEDDKESSPSVLTKISRVKFMLDGDGDDKGGKLLLGNSKINNSVGGDFSNENDRINHFVNVINEKYHQVEARNRHTDHTTTGTTHVDISHEMLNLLRSCSDIVADAKRSFGYVPYHAL
ncbi:PWWP domain-containing protein 1-like [Cornus florida]|uniref:PWWP domain-containing protein 1-like n=1 Tax=Cornus florida TaxID=4283 RepID=UPI002897ED7D|nr:PWWP domain-containing protein 1-like [Cornus florida]XP_059632721.1 PWWP domain-containing protein 1-like [Cornus florida]